MLSHLDQVLSVTMKSPCHPMRPARCPFHLSLLAILTAGGLLMSGCGSSEFKSAHKRAQAGEMQAQFDLSQMYMYGKGTKQSEVEARKWCEKAANQGLPAAMRIYGTMLRDAYGADHRNIAKAREWLAKAVAKGDTLAKAELDSTPEPGK